MVTYKKAGLDSCFLSKTIFHFINLSIFIFIYYLFAVVLTPVRN